MGAKSNPWSMHMRKIEGGREQALRWHAIQIASQLPEDTEEARRVLDLTRQVVDGFIQIGSTPGPQLAVHK